MRQTEGVVTNPAISRWRRVAGELPVALILNAVSCRHPEIKE
jgi:hypothetical protein